MSGKPNKKTNRIQKSKAESILALLGGIANYKSRLNDPESDEWDNNQYHTNSYVGRSLCRIFRFSEEGDDRRLEKLNDSLIDEQRVLYIQKKVRIKDFFSETKVKCDERISWDSEMAVCRRNGRYALYLRNKGLLTPFIFSKYRTSCHPERMYVWFGDYKILVNLTPRGIIYKLGSFYFEHLRDMVAEAITGKIHKTKREEMEKYPDCCIWTIGCAE